MLAQGFGQSSNDNVEEPQMERTYGKAVETPIRDMIDVEGAMAAFFSANEEWLPAFRSLAHSPSVPAMTFIGGAHGEPIDDSTMGPWRKLDAIPSSDADREKLSAFLESMHKFLVDIPVNESVEEDEDDLHFLEEGRRMLAISRFHVLSENRGGSVESHEALFSMCWSELVELRRADQENTGSLILLPDYDLADLRRFTDMNVLRPLEWLGLANQFEVASLQRDSPAIRILHKLQDMPEDLPAE
jgi:hypothetical protein